MRAALPLIVPALLLAGCGEAERQEDVSASEETAVAPENGAEAGAQASTEETPPLPQPNGTAGQEPPAPDRPAPGTSLPPAGEGLRFVGLWAVDRESCADRAWRFTRDSLHTPAGSVCRFTRVTPVGGGYDIAARCTAEGPETEDELQIRFAESAQAMMFESDLIADAGLIYCGRG